jgi:predicted transcriptional regulator
VKYRSRIDIVADILRIAADGAIKTKIMYSAYLSYPQLKEYLELLTEVGLIDYEVGEKAYHTTTKGMHFVKIYKELGAMLPRGKRNRMAAGK